MEEPGSISGNVVNSADTEVVIGDANVTVTLAGSSTYDFVSSTETDSLGVFSIGQLPVGIYDLTISAVGYELYNDVTPGGGITITAGGIIDIGTIGLVPSTP